MYVKKNDLFQGILLFKTVYVLEKNTTLMFKSSSKNKFTLL